MSNGALSIALPALLALIALSAFFSSAESALVSLDAVHIQRMREKDRRRADIVSRLLGDYSRLISTLLVGNTLVNVAVASLGYAVIDALWPRYSAAVSIVAMTIVLLLFGEVGPKRLALAYADRLALAYARPLLFFETVLAPLCAVLQRISGSLGGSLRPERRTLNDEELVTAVEVGAEMGVFDSEETAMVDGILRLSEMEAHDVMTPRVDLECLDLDDPPERHLELARSTTCSFLPLYRETPDSIEGFLDVARYLLDPEHNLEAATTSPLFVPETAALDDLLITLQRGNRHIAVVLDEYGGTAGLITRGDILELIADDVADTPADEIPEIRAVGPRSWEIDGDTSVEEINHELGLELEEDGADRIGGWVIAQAGRFLGRGESIEAHGVRVQVLRRRRVRIRTVLLEILDHPTEDQAIENADLEDNEIPVEKEAR